MRLAALRALSATLIACTIFFSACAKRRKPPAPLAPKIGVSAAPAAGSTETGFASWYGHPYHGRRAANGEVYDMEKMTAAHRTLPFGARVRVANLSNGKHTEVRINDRGPFVDGRIIDLSRAAARAIGLLGPGVVKVRLTVLGYGPAPGAPAFAVQVGAFRDKRRAEDLAGELEQRYAPVRLAVRDGDPRLWRVLVGRKASPEEAEALADTLRKRGIEAFVVRWDEEPSP